MTSQTSIIYGLITAAVLARTLPLVSGHLDFQESQKECANQIQRTREKRIELTSCHQAMAHAKTLSAIGTAILPKP